MKSLRWRLAAWFGEQRCCCSSLAFFGFTRFPNPTAQQELETRLPGSPGLETARQLFQAEIDDIMGES